MTNKFFYSILCTAFVLSGVFSFTACKKDDAVLMIDIPEQSICFAASQFIGEQVYTFELAVSEIESAFTQAGYAFDLNKITEVKAVQFKATAANSGNFNYISGMQVYAKTPSTTGNGTQIAFVDIASGTTVANLSANGTDLKSLLSADRIIFDVRMFNNQNNTPQTCFTLSGGALDFRISQKKK